jgi:uncharacterized protein (TIGR03437 family)
MGMSVGWRVVAVLLAIFFWGQARGVAAVAAPVVESVTDSAGYGPRVAPGSLASIFGTNLASGDASATAFPLPTQLGGSSVEIGGVAAPLLFVSPGQINFQVPSATASGDVSVVVTGPGGAGAAFTFTVTSSAPSIFQYGTNHAVAQNGATLNGDSAPAASGSVVTVYLTGIGAVNNAVDDGSPTPVSPLSAATATATATIGPASATIQFLGLTPDFAGLAQANIEVPSLPTGDYPLVITVGGYLSASAVISVSGSGTYTSLLQLTGSVAFPNSSESSIALYDNVAYVCGSDSIVMVDVTDAASPGVIGEFGADILGGYGDSCAINQTAGIPYPYLVQIVGQSTGDESFAVWGLSNPQSPNLLDVATTPYGHMENLTFSGDYGFVTDSYITYYINGSDQYGIAAQNGDFIAFNFTNPAAPTYLGILEPSGAAGSGDQNLKPYSEVVDQAYAYVASSTATGTSTSGEGFLDVLSIASPSAPYPVSVVTVSQAAILLSFDISGNTLLAAGNTAGQRNPGIPDFDFTGDLTLTTMDLTNVAAPVVLETFTSTLQVNGTFHVFAFSNGVFAVVNNPPDTDDFGPSMLMIVDASTPASMVVYQYQTQFGFSGILTTSNNYLLAATSLGLNIYSLQIQ